MPLPASLKGQDLILGHQKKAGQVLVDAADGVFLYTKGGRKILLSLVHPVELPGGEPGTRYQLLHDSTLTPAGDLEIRRVAGAALMHVFSFELSAKLRKQIGCDPLYRLVAFSRTL